MSERLAKFDRKSAREAKRNQSETGVVLPEKNDVADLGQERKKRNSSKKTASVAEVRSHTAESNKKELIGLYKNGKIPSRVVNIFNALPVYEQMQYLSKIREERQARSEVRKRPAAEFAASMADVLLHPENLPEKKAGEIVPSFSEQLLAQRERSKIEAEPVLPGQDIESEEELPEGIASVTPEPEEISIDEEEVHAESEKTNELGTEDELQELYARLGRDHISPLDPEYERFKHLLTDPEVEELGKPLAGPMSEPVDPATVEELERPEPSLHLEDLEDVTDVSTPEAETTKEWRSKLKALIGGFGASAQKVSGTLKEQAIKTNEKFDWWKSSKEELIRRSKDLDTKLEHIGGVELTFRWFGEQYNKMDWKTKLLIGAGLGLGATISSGVSLPVSLAFSVNHWLAEKLGHIGKSNGAAAAIQRDSSASPISTPEKAMAQQGTESPAQTSQTPAVQSAASTAGTEAPATASAQMHTNAEPAPSASAPEVSQAPVESVPAQETPNVSDIKISASKGHGYEYMMKRLWEQLHDQNVQLPTNADPNSDLYRLVHADASTIDKVVHDIASDQRHQFFHDGVSARVDPDAELYIGAKGELHISTPRYDYQAIPHHVPTTPEYHSSGLPATETNAPAVAFSNPEPISRVDVTPPEQVATVDVTPSPVVGSAASRVEGLDGLDVASTPAPIVETAPESVVNRLGITIPKAEAHIYSDPSERNLFVYGGAMHDRLITIREYLIKNPYRVVYSEDLNGHRIPWYRTSEGNVVSGAPVATGGFLGLFPKYLPPPSTEDFAKVVL